MRSESFCEDISARLNNIENRVTALEEYAEKLDTRTSQIARDLFEMQDRLDQATRALKREPKSTVSRQALSRQARSAATRRRRRAHA